MNENGTNPSHFYQETAQTQTPGGACLRNPLDSLRQNLQLWNRQNEKLQARVRELQTILDEMDLRCLAVKTLCPVRRIMREREAAKRQAHHVRRDERVHLPHARQRRAT